MAVYLDDFFYKVNEKNLDFFVKIDIFSETISSGSLRFGINPILPGGGRIPPPSCFSSTILKRLKL